MEPLPESLSPSTAELPVQDDRVGEGDLWRACAIAAAFGLVYWASFQTRLYGDGPGLVTWYVEGVFDKFHHALYMPTLQLLGVTVALQGPYAVPGLLSILSGALLAGFTYLLVRGLGARRGVALTATGLCALAPLVWFFATTIEVPIFHGAVVAMVACVTVYAPWEKPNRALLVVALFFPLLYLSHQTAVLLGPGWVALVTWSQARRGQAMGWGRALFVVGPALLAALLVGIAVGNAWRIGEFSLVAPVALGVLDEFLGAALLTDFLWRGWILPLGLLLPAALVGAWRMRAERLRLATLLLLLLPPLVFFAWWRVPERGAYFVGLAPFYAVLAARALAGTGSYRTHALRLIGPLLVAAQALIAWLWIDAWDRGFDPRQRVQQVERHLGQRGTLFSIHPGAPQIRLFLPDVDEVHLSQEQIQPAYELGLGPEAWAAIAAPGIELLEPRGAIGFDLSYQREDKQLIRSVMDAYLEALFAELEGDWVLERCEHESWPLVVLQPR